MVWILHAGKNKTRDGHATVRKRLGKQALMETLGTVK